MKRMSRPLWFALAAVLLDGLWALYVLREPDLSRQTATVEMAGTTVWIFLHLPAALLASLPYLSLPAEAPVPRSEFLVMGLLGLAWSGGLAWALGWWMGRESWWRRWVAGIRTMSIYRRWNRWWGRLRR